jgi:diguanylate cyclase (GGDEF)-like protein
MDESRNVIGAEASSLMLVDPETDELYFHVVYGDKSDAVKPIRIKKGQGVAGKVAQTGESILVKDAKTDDRVYKGVDEKSNFVTENLMAVALKGRRGIVGVVEVLNKIGNETFNETDLIIFEAFAVQAGIAIENARLYEMATTDGMTSLYNKSFFNFRLNEEIYNAKHNDKKIAILLVDIDHFKRVNDTYGHQAGDKVIIEVSKIMKQACGKNDLACRYGGEELVIISPGSTKEQILDLGEKIRFTVQNSTFKVDNQNINITVSIGCAVFSQKIKNAEEFIEMADLALYYGKENGRNAITMFDPKTMKKIE